jgi:thiol-disulfide isomerase/thioredoxin
MQLPKYTCKSLSIILALTIIVSIFLQYLQMRRTRTNPPKQNTKETFSDQSNEEDYLLFFYADWCGHCTAFKPAVRDFYDTNMIRVLYINNSGQFVDDENTTSKKDSSKKYVEMTKEYIENKNNITSDSELELFNKNLQKEFDVTGYPTLYYVKNNNKSKFGGSYTRDVESLERFVSDMRDSQ